MATLFLPVWEIWGSLVLEYGLETLNHPAEASFVVSVYSLCGYYIALWLQMVNCYLHCQAVHCRHSKSVSQVTSDVVQTRVTVCLSMVL